MTEEARPTQSPVEEKLRGVLAAMGDAVTALLGGDAPERFGRASRLCLMGQKISVELVTSVREAQRLRRDDEQQLKLARGLGPEGQYIAEGGGDVGGYLQDQQDYAILNPAERMGEYIPGMAAAMPRPNDMATLQRDMMTMLADWFSDQKKSKATPKKKDPSDARLELYTELNELLRSRDKLQDPKDAALRAIVEKKINSYIDLIGKDDSHDAPDPDVVPAELLRGHPPGASEQRRDPGRDRGPVLHREGRAEGPPGGGNEEWAPEIGVG